MILHKEGVKLKKCDYILIFVYITISITISISSIFYIKKIDNPMAEVNYEGQKILALDLSENSTAKFKFGANVGYLEIKASSDINEIDALSF